MKGKVSLKAPNNLAIFWFLSHISLSSIPDYNNTKVIFLSSRQSKKCYQNEKENSPDNKKNKTLINLWISVRKKQQSFSSLVDFVYTEWKVWFWKFVVLFSRLNKAL